MNAPFKQAERLGRLTTELGPDVLALLRFDGSDHLNALARRDTNPSRPNAAIADFIGCI